MIDLQQSGAGLAGYALLAAQAEALFADERDFIANAAQFSAFLFHELGDLNWAGFYLNRNEELVLGPFQGKVACVRIPQGRLRRRGAYPADPAGRRRPRVSRPHRLRQRFQQRTGGAPAQGRPPGRCARSGQPERDASAPRTRPGSKAWWRYSCA